MEELFKIEDQKSPKLIWMEKHKVNHHHCKTEEKDFQYMAWMGEQPDSETKCGYGSTLQEALCDMAKRNKIVLWNEEDFAKRPLVN
jgi:hypothetical protein